MSDENPKDDAPHEAAPGATPEDDATPVVAKKNRKPLLIGLAIAVVVIGALYLLYDVFIGSRSVSTDNAYVAGESAQVTPLTSGRITDVMVTDTQSVKKGQILFRIEDTDQKIAVAQAEALLTLSQRRYSQSRAQGAAATASADAEAAAVPEAQAKLSSASAALDKARTDYSRRAALAGSGAVSAEELTTAKNALADAQASYKQASAALGQARANAVSARKNETATNALTQGTTVSTAPEVRAAQARLAQARLDLERTVVRAPVDGVVSKRTVQVGQKVESGNTAMIIVPVNQLYVDANFKENQLGKVRPGQDATVTSDFYGSDVVYHGKVVGFAGGTGAAFSLIPAQNATGNWIKVVQRLPVRIALDPKELREHPLRVGLSMEAEIDLTSNH